MTVDEALSALRGEMDRRHDNLDGGLLAPDWVQAMTWDEQVAAMEELSADTALLEAHQALETPEGAICPVDGQEHPCEALQALVERYVTPEGPEAGRARDLDELIERLGQTGLG